MAVGIRLSTSPGGWLERRVRGLYPGSFALVMATGIVSNAFFFLGHDTLSTALLWVNLVAYPLLVALTVARAVGHPRALWSDLVNPRLVFSFFTMVAATDILGTQLNLRGYDGVATGLWVAALSAWVLLGYFSFAVVTFDDGQSGADVVHGGWLIAIVGTESLVVLGAPLASGLGDFAPYAFVIIYTLWGVGIAFYGIFVTLFAYRLFFLPVQPADMNPLFWVVMGAAAISANAGSSLILTDPELPFLMGMRPFLNGMTLLLWAWATWWIPLLVIFGVWRHLVRRQPLRYHPMYWSLVFPLGMYAVATHRLSLAADFPPIQQMSRVIVWVAFVTWALAMAGLVRAARDRPSSAPA
jgi:tellurite resistance protein TehA-like permease